MTDPIVDEVRRVREELIERYGGLDGYMKHCEQQDRRRTSANRSKGRGKKRQQPAPSHRRNSRPLG